MKTLYVSDLDGTLLRSDQRTSEYTNRVVNGLVEKGLLFSYATARSFNTAHKVTAGMTAAFPLIVYNGAFIRDNATGKMLLESFFDRDKAVPMILDLVNCGVSPIVYSFVDGVERFSYVKSTLNAATRDFILTRKGDSRDRPVNSPEEMLEGNLFYVTCIDTPERLGPLSEKYEPVFRTLYQSDMYTGEQWLELIPKEVSKANAIRELKRLLGCDHLVVFGDGINDIDMFEIADEAYAVENAVPELKALATGIIGANDEDGVAKWLLEHV